MQTVCNVSRALLWKGFQLSVSNDNNSTVEIVRETCVRHSDPQHIANDVSIRRRRLSGQSSAVAVHTIPGRSSDQQC